ncbi:MAG: sulfatase-like hydrolase/transferase [Acidobacteriaceae bacterium]|nr:sulfatase-like hydrolase/transferase [Acidobacteriaceae bacterium]
MSRPVRHTVILALVGLGTLLAAVGGWRYARASAPVNGPIVLISIDALRADRLLSYGGRGTATPHLDALATDGIVFEHAYAQVPQTLPSHVSLFTGRLPFEHGVRDGVGFTLKPSERTLADMLSARGYATGGIVSSFLLRPATGINRGFAFFDADLGPASAFSHPLTRAGNDAEQVAEHWLDSLGTSRALLFLNLADPLTSAPDASPARYDAGVASADAAVGRLVQYLKAHQLYDRSTIIVLSDHGEGLGDHGESGHGLLTYDESVRVPLIIKQPESDARGRRVNDVVQLIDIAPTVLDLTKAPIPGTVRGRSLTPLFAGSTTFRPARAYSESLFGAYHFGWADVTSVTDGRYRYIASPREELYDLDADPAERQNIAAAQPAIAAQLKAALKDLSATGPAAAMAPVTAADREMLEALGYVGTFTPSQPSTEPSDVKDGVRTVEQFRRAVARLNAGEIVAALDEFRALAAATKDNPDIWRHVAEIARDAERNDIALDAWKHALALLPTNLNAQFGAASAALRARKLDEARRLARAILDAPTAEPAEHAAAHEILAQAALAARNPGDARHEAALAEELVPDRPVSGYITGRIAFDRKRYADALDAFEPAMAAMDKRPEESLADLRLVTAEALAATARYAEAEYLFTRELEVHPHSVRARTGLMSVYKATGRTDEAAALSR